MDKSISIEEIAIKALWRSFQIHKKLGAAGLESVKKNQFKETTLRADIEQEQAVIDVLTEANIPIRIFSEEHGTFDIGEEPIYSGVLDGLDGSNVYKKEIGKGRYGTMFGIFSGLDPQYDDYIFSGVMEPAAKRLFYAVKGKGSFVVIERKKKPIRCSGTVGLDKQTRIYIDEYYEVNRKTFSEKLQGFNKIYQGASEAYYVDLASGKADLVLECTRKGNLEIAVAYGMVVESGGTIIAKDGITLGQRKYLAFGQGQTEYIPIISASTLQLAQALIKHINQN